MVNPAVLVPILEIGKRVLDKFIPDEGERQKAEAEFLRSAMDGELKQVIAQLEINAKEAMHPSIWVAGWRPFFGWVGGLGFFYATVGQPLLTWWAYAYGKSAPPEVNTDLLWIVVSGLLGIGGLRTFEKTKKVAK